MLRNPVKAARVTAEDAFKLKVSAVPYRLLSFVAFVVSLCCQAVQAADLTPLEVRWLRGIWPVVAHARQALSLPMDLVVQPQDTPGAAPLSMGFVDGRCKLVLSMRGNPQAEQQAARIEPALFNATMELMAAHEMGHCHRYLDGAWTRLPAGFVAPKVPDGVSPAMRQAWLDMRSTRREEGYGDLVGLAWTHDQHPELYARLHGWLTAERAAELVPGSHHDTLAWLALAKDPAAFSTGSLFDAIGGVWAKGVND